MEILVQNEYLSLGVLNLSKPVYVLARAGTLEVGTEIRGELDCERLVMVTKLRNSEEAMELLQFGHNPT